MLNGCVVDKYFADLSKIVVNLDLQEKSENIWNCDETGKQLEHTPVNVIASRGSKSVVGRTGNDRSNITIMTCVNATGDSMPPMLIVKGKTKKSLFGFKQPSLPKIQFLHCSDHLDVPEPSEEGYDSLHKISPVINILNEAFGKNYR